MGVMEYKNRLNIYYKFSFYSYFKKKIVIQMETTSSRVTLEVKETVNFTSTLDNGKLYSNLFKFIFFSVSFFLQFYPNDIDTLVFMSIKSMPKIR